MFPFHLLLRQKVEPKGDHDPSRCPAHTGPRHKPPEPVRPRGSWTPTHARPSRACVDWDQVHVEGRRHHYRNGVCLSVCVRTGKEEGKSTVAVRSRYRWMKLRE